MKKRYTCVLCLLLALLAIPVMAAESVQVGVKASATTVRRGDEVTVMVSAEVDSCKSGGIELSFDSKVFELVSGEFLLSDTFMQDFDAAALDGVFAYTSAKQLSGDAFRFVLKVKDTAAFGETGVSVTLTADGKTSTESVMVKVSCDHSYDNACDTTCSVCGETRTITHSWNDGEVTTAATCTAEGVKTFTCTVCKEVKTEAVAKLSHQYDNDCDATCNACGAQRSISHKYRTEWSSDESGHRHTCSVCGDRKDEAAHTPGPEPTEWDPQTCTVCGYVLQKALGHTHNFASEYTTDEDGHWYACSGCDEKQDYYDHTFDNDCDTSCEYCGYVRETEHNYSNRLSFSSEGHWYACTACGDVMEMYPHNPGPEATEETDQICMDCGYVLQPAGAHEHYPAGDWLSDAQGHWHQCSCGELIDNGTHTWGEGVVDEEANTETHHCTVCGYPRVTLLPDDPTEPSETQPQTNPPTQGSTQTPQETKPQGSGDDQQDPDREFPWWIVAVVVCVLLIGGTVFVIIGILTSRKQNGKYSG